MDVLINLVGSAALLLWGVRMVRTGIMRSFGAELRRLLTAVGDKTFGAFIGGAAVTVLLQSSMATALLISTFTTRAAISGPLAIATILGADLGSAIVVKLFSHRVDWLSPTLIAIGVIAFLMSTRARAKGASRAILGLGLVLLALSLIGQAAAPLAKSESVGGIVAMLASDRLLTFVLGILLTLLMHSSVAAILMVATLCGSGVVPLATGIAMVLGANIGSALLPVLPAMAAADGAPRFLVANVVLRSLFAVLALPWISIFVSWLANAGLEGAHAVAGMHLSFNLALSLLALPFVTRIDRLLERLLPAASAATIAAPETFLDESALGTPSVALASATRQALKIAETVQGMLNSTIRVLRTNDVDLRDRIEAEDDAVDRQYEAVKLYLARLTREELDPDEGDRSIEILSFTTNLEHIGDIIDKNLMELASKKIRARASFSDAGMKELETFHACIAENLELALNVFVSGDLSLARRLLRQKAAIRDLERRSIERHMERIGAGSSAALDTSSLHLDVLRDLKRINGHLTAVAYPILERAGELAQTRLRSADESAPVSVRSHPEPDTPGTAQ